jgi:hypothetical protein
MATYKVALEEIVGLERYERERNDLRARIIALKKQRRVPVGDRVTFVFENHDTMLFQIQEMLRAEHIVDLDRVREEVAVYNELVPNESELSATLLIEITDSQRIREDLVRLIGIDECVSLHIGRTHRIPAQFEPGRSKEDKLSAVQYVRFRFEPTQRQAFLSGTEPIRLAIEHPNYRHAAEIDRSVWESLKEDLR